jgi:hypothetical protein
MSGAAVKNATPILLALAAVGATACDLAYPQVAVVNRLGQAVQIRAVSFNGCAWSEVLAVDQATPPGKCLPGDDNVHFQMFDAEAWAQEQAKAGNLAGVTTTGATTTTPATGSAYTGPVPIEPLWYNYQTTAVIHVGYGDFKVVDVTSEAIEADFSIPGPYGH